MGGGAQHAPGEEAEIMARIEFYIGDADKFIAFTDDGAVPPVGALINIRKVTYEVGRVTWTVDNADDVMNAKLRANVELRLPESAKSDSTP